MSTFRSRLGELIQRYKFSRTFPIRKKVNILTWDKTLQKVNNDGLSLSRFGDGELLIIFQYLKKGISQSTFQNYDEELGKRLYEILTNLDNDKCLVCLPHCMFGRGVDDMNFGARYFWERFSNRWLDLMISILPIKDKEFGDTNLTRFYNDFKDKSESRNKIDSIKTLWKEKSVLIVEGEKTRMGVGNDLFKETKNVRRILIPQRDAFKKYNEILAEIKSQYKKGDLVLIAAGMTATVLAYDLSNCGIQALDIGHLDIEYSWLNVGATNRVKVEGKFTNESDDRDNVSECRDESYLSSIVSRIL